MKNAVIVSPDAGGAKRASSMAAKLDLDFALFHKERKKANEVSRMVLVGSVKDKVAILVDDMADTCGTLAMASERLIEAGAKDVIALVTHGILSGPAFEKLAKSSLSRLIVTNSVPQTEHVKHSDRLQVVDVSQVLAETIVRNLDTPSDVDQRRSYYGESVSQLFDSVVRRFRDASLTSQPFADNIGSPYAEHNDSNGKSS